MQGCVCQGICGVDFCSAFDEQADHTGTWEEVDGGLLEKLLVPQFVLSHAGHVEQAITVSRPRVDADHDGVDASFHLSQAVSVSAWNAVKKIYDNNS